MGFRFLLFFFVSLFSLTGFSYSLDVYSENTFLGREGLLSSQTRLRTEKEDRPVFQPYLTAGTELYTPGRDDYSLSADSFAFFGGGVKLAPFYGLSLTAEGRLRGRYLPSSPNEFSTTELRSLLVYGNFFSSPWSENQALFLEPYTETLFTTLDSSNIINASQIKAGNRWTALTGDSRLYVDLFVEPYFTLDTRRHYYNNRGELRLSNRVTFAWKNLSASVSFTYLWNQYFSRGDLDPNPYVDKNSGFRSMLVLGGQL